MHPLRYGVCRPIRFLFVRVARLADGQRLSDLDTGVDILLHHMGQLMQEEIPCRNARRGKHDFGSGGVSLGAHGMRRVPRPLIVVYPHLAEVEAISLLGLGNELGGR